MPGARRTRTIAAAPQRIWEVVEDPHHMPRWWPGVTRMEAVEGEHFTQVFKTKKGRPVRLDFRVLTSEPPWQRSWEQVLEGSPLQRVLSESITDVVLEPDGTGTRVTIEQRQKLRGYSRTGSFMWRRATRGRLDEALDGLERIFG
jgi:uncharacterized protein YndB with AHSA1/START domain